MEKANTLDEKLIILEHLLETRENETNPDTIDRQINETWRSFLLEFPKTKDVRTQIDDIEKYVEERKPGLITRLKNNALINKTTLKQANFFIKNTTT